LVFPNGERRPILGNALPLFDTEGKVRGCVGVFLDIGARKQTEAALQRSEERLRRAQRAARIGTWDWDLQTGTASWTEEACIVFGRQPDGLTLNYENWLACVHPENRATAEAAIHKSRQGGKYHDEYRVLDADGSVRWIESRGETVFDAGGRPVRMLGTALDITERKETERQLSDIRRQLQQHAETLEATVAERTGRLREMIAELEALSYSIAHDMRAPLRAMQGFATVLMSDHAAQLDRNARTYLERIAAAARRMDGFIVDILDYSKIVRGRLEVGPVDVGKLIREIITWYPSFHNGQADIRIEAPLPGMLANEAALTQVVSNLLDNAIKFVAPEIRPRVRVRAEQHAGTVRLWFEDNGIGIDRSAQARLFTIFGRLNSPEHYEGTGIGLAIVRKSVERMGGGVGVESEPGSGSRFWIQLPASGNS
jgi:PAS domain S-box-containing protein